MANIRHLLNIKAKPEIVYQALTTAAGIRNWWTDNADLDENVGGAGVFRFHYVNIVETRVDIVTLEAPAVVAWQVTTSFRPEQNGTLITFELQQEGAGTILTFGHTGFAAEDKTYAMMNTGWAYYLVSLQQYLETGKGAPSPFVDFSIMTRKSKLLDI